MDISAFILLTVTFTLLLLMFQRTERKRRLIVAVGLILVGVLIVRYVNYRGFHSEAQIGFAIAAVGNFLFWLLIGRYNPVASSDNIQVIGMDD